MFRAHMPIIRRSRPYLYYYRMWCVMSWLLVVGGHVQGSRLCVRDEGSCSSSFPHPGRTLCIIRTTLTKMPKTKKNRSLSLSLSFVSNACLFYPYSKTSANLIDSRAATSVLYAQESSVAFASASSHRNKKTVRWSVTVSSASARALQRTKTRFTHSLTQLGCDMQQGLYIYWDKNKSREFLVMVKFVMCVCEFWAVRFRSVLIWKMG